MVFVFGFDIPLIELLVLIFIGFVLLLALLIYNIINQYKTNQRLEKIISEEKKESKLLNRIKKKLNKKKFRD